MPYTPPSQQSPVTSGKTSPSSNGPQLHEGRSSPSQESPQRPSTSPAHSRPPIPRSSNSAGYLNRPRRSSSWNEHDPHKLYTLENSRPTSSSSPSLSSSSSSSSQSGPHEATSSIRQSPSPVADSSMPPGAMISPPDSTQNSSDDESPPSTGSSRQVEGLEELQKAIHSSFQLNKTPSSPPNGAVESLTASSSADHHSSNNHYLRLVVPDQKSDLTPSMPARLSPSARKISHSRSATETSFFDMRSASLQSSQTTSDDSDEDLDPSHPKPPLLRKKSGELVKPAIRPSSRRKHMSMPGTPTFSKAVHFNDNIEQVRHFLQVDRPIAVSAGASPADAYEEESEFPFGKGARTPEGATSSAAAAKREGILEIKLANFPRQTLERQALPIRVEKISLSADQKSLIGAIAVANLAFHKLVVARFTFDYWKTTSEVTAEYHNDTRQGPRADGYDQFNFSIKLTDLTNLESKTLLLCVRYQVNSTEYWDNNDSMNFQVDFNRTRPPPPASEKPAAATTAVAPSAPATPIAIAVSEHHSPTSGPGSRPLPRSKHNSGASPRPRSMPSFDDDFASSLDASSMLKFRNRPSSFPEASNRKAGASNGQPFASRYDFGASLSAALSQAQAQLGDRSGIKANEPGSKTDASATAGAQSLARSGIAPPANSGADSPRPDTLLANNQTLDSRAYQEFVSKFCFFGSSAKPSPQSVPLPLPQQQSKELPGGTDGAQDESPMTTSNYTYLPQRDESVSTGSGLDAGYFDTTSSFLSAGHLGDASSSSYPRSAPPVFHHHTAAGHGFEAIGRAGSPGNSFGYPFALEFQQSMFGQEPHTPQVIRG